MNDQFKNESFYDRYFMQIWYALGYIAGASLIFNPMAIKKAGLILSLAVSFGVAIPIAFFLYTIYIFSSFILSLIFEGVKERNILFIFIALYLLLGLASFIIGALYNKV